ncbi:MAG: Rieske 2Fe-2S domain-containing protein [Chitinispirillaceae bacterium]|nr:Rieske 2Fe-2S domain-containing protein [Chitinispirillaceae bacterium]
MISSRITRRHFLEKAGQAGLAAAMVSPLTGVSAFAGKKTHEPVIVDLTRPENAPLLTPGGMIKVPDPANKKRPIIVSRLSETDVAAFSSKCTHLGCEVNISDDGTVACPCHKALFDASGKVKKGPARKNLKRFDALLGDMTIVIK